MENLKILRNQRGLTQAEVASFLNISKQTYCHYEKNRYEPDISTLIKIADFFDCSVDYLIEHKTQKILHLDSFTSLQQEIIGYIQKLDDNQLNVVKGTLGAMAGISLQDLLKTGSKD